MFVSTVQDHCALPLTRTNGKRTEILRPQRVATAESTSCVALREHGPRARFGDLARAKEMEQINQPKERNWCVAAFDRFRGASG